MKVLKRKQILSISDHKWYSPGLFTFPNYFPSMIARIYFFTERILSSSEWSSLQSSTRSHKYPTEFWLQWQTLQSITNLSPGAHATSFSSSSKNETSARKRCHSVVNVEIYYSTMGRSSGGDASVLGTRPSRRLADAFVALFVFSHAVEEAKRFCKDKWNFRW